ncbi:LysR family transcriptional regulator [Pararhizobium sp.]|uniref:LysR family transcriptional regulator n=1 Tax=Pararhizobium sp. TaxID=1977563 RepID=UPI002721986E|nr:LysR family transcriptional regulator [Pararhizobium sp.]MDO9414641.1 LysR family transcriptional regulator [Pararhizobium sp.]
MDIATLHTVHTILSERGIRKASRLIGRPPASVSAALQRFEQAIAVPLVRREGALLVPTLEAQARMADLDAARTAIAELMAPGCQPTSKPVPSISLSTLGRFVTVARSGSIRGSARTLGLGQPQLTRDISALEQQLAYPLLTRSPSGVTCTDDGMAAIAICERLVDIWARLSRASADRFRKTAATWRLGAVIPFGHESDIAAMLASLTTGWMKARPRQPLFLSSTTADELIAGLKTRRFDVVLIDMADYPAEFEGALVARSGLALAGGTARSPEQSNDLSDILLTHPIAVPSAKSGLRRETSRFLERTLTEAQRNRLTLIEVDSIPVIINLVRNHGFLSVLPHASIANIAAPPPLINLGPDYVQSLSLVWQKNALSREAGQTMLGIMGR